MAAINTIKDASFWIEKLGLKKHPEGGFYRETYRSDETIRANALPERFADARSISSSIYFLLRGKDFSALHCIKSDELWHFYTGGTLIIHSIDQKGKYFRIQLGNNFDNGEVFQALLKSGFWFGATLKDHTSYSLVGCTVSPGFDFKDFEMGNRAKLIKLYPKHRSIIEKLTR
ncbi:MAG: cupin domain-containing protein [Thermodesulfobacteriota bacterium]|nr:cupin domain-containing protein [Thermodesulfobacteriota bacterium]